MLDQKVECHLGGVIGAMEHGFTGEQAAYGNTINAPHQFSIPPAFDAVGMALPMQPRVCLDEFSGDPGVVPFGTGCGTSLDHLPESAVNRDFKSPLPNDFGQAF